MDEKVKFHQENIPDRFNNKVQYFGNQERNNKYKRIKNHSI